jgi:hypothetical protein
VPDATEENIQRSLLRKMGNKRLAIGAMAERSLDLCNSINLAASKEKHGERVVSADSGFGDGCTWQQG